MAILTTVPRSHKDLNVSDRGRVAIACLCPNLQLLWGVPGRQWSEEGTVVNHQQGQGSLGREGRPGWSDPTDELL